MWGELFQDQQWRVVQMGKIGLEEEERVAFIPLGAKSPLSFTLLDQLRLIQDFLHF